MSTIKVVRGRRDIQLRINHHNCPGNCRHCFLGKPGGSELLTHTEETIATAEALGFDSLIYVTDQANPEYERIRDLTFCFTPNLSVLSGDGYDNHQNESEPFSITLISEDPEVHDAVTTKGHHAKTMRVLEQLREREAKFDVWTVAYGRNYDTFPAFYEYARAQGAKAVFVTKLVGLGNGADLPEDYFLTPAHIERFLRDTVSVYAEHEAHGMQVIPQACWGPLLTGFERRLFAAVGPHLEHPFCPGADTVYGVDPVTKGVWTCNYTAAAGTLQIGTLDPARGLVITEDWPYCRDDLGEPCASCEILDACRGGCRGLAILEHQMLTGEVDVQAGFATCPVALDISLPPSWSKAQTAIKTLLKERGMMAIH